MGEPRHRPDPDNPGSGAYDVLRDGKILATFCYHEGTQDEARQKAERYDG